MTIAACELPILLVDDEPEILFSVSITLSSELPNQVMTENDPRKVLPLLRKQALSSIILDLNMPDVSGQELLGVITRDYPQIPVIIMTATSTIETAVECMRSGAFDYLVKPVENSRILTSVQRALEIRRLRGEIDSLKSHMLEDKLLHEAAFAPIITRSRKMRSLFSYLDSVANTARPLLIAGETGVGKDLLAKAVHDASGRRGRFIAVNVAELDNHSFSDTLFGHRRGAFTGADQAREGLVAEAANGTLLLEEIGDLSEPSQVKLLRLIQANEYYPLGSDVAKRNNARIIATTNRQMQQMIESGKFRRDLHCRLSTHNCEVPPLRERREDIAVLFRHFLAEAAQELDKMEPLCSQETVDRLAAYSFPGNVRELQNMVYDAVARQKSGELTARSLGSFLRDGAESPEPGSGDTLSATPEGMDTALHPFPTLRESTDRLIEQAMAKAGGNQRIAASLLGITRQALNNRLVRRQQNKK